METTLGAVAESQQNISNPIEQAPATTPVVEQAQPQAEQQVVTQPAVEQDNGTGTSSGDVTQTTQDVEAPKEVSAEELLNQVNSIINEGKTLETVAAENEQTQIEKENAEALDAIVKEQTKDLPSEPAEVKTDAQSLEEESNQLDEELKQGLEDIKSKKDAEDMAKKVYLAFQKERSMHQFDNEQNKNTIDVLKGMVKKLNEQVATSDNDPRVTKLDDEFYTLRRLEQSYKKDKSNTSKQNLTRYYVAKLATLNPVMNANKIMDIFTNAPLPQNTMGENTQVNVPVAEVKKQELPRQGIPASKRGMY